MRVGNSTYLVPVLVAVGVDKRGIKTLILPIKKGENNDNTKPW